MAITLGAHVYPAASTIAKSCHMGSRYSWPQGLEMDVHMLEGARSQVRLVNSISSDGHMPRESRMTTETLPTVVAESPPR